MCDLRVPQVSVTKTRTSKYVTFLYCWVQCRTEVGIIEVCDLLVPKMSVSIKMRNLEVCDLLVPQLSVSSKNE